MARSDEDRETFLRKRGFSKSETAKIVETVLQEEGRPPESLFDFVQGITALARGKAHQDARLELEGKAKRLLEANDFLKYFKDCNVHSANWTKYQDRCKKIVTKKKEIDLMIDDRLDYVMEGSPMAFLMVPRQSKPYYHSSWVNVE